MVRADNDNERVAIDFFTNLSAGNLERVRDIFHDEATWTVQVTGVAGAGVHHGKKGIVDDFLTPVRGMFKPGDPKILIDTIASKGPLVLIESRGKGTFADGRPYNNLYAWALEIKDGKVYRLREYMDSLHVAKLQGLAS
jgi:ketosteroid isomerase-like protein